MSLESAAAFAQRAREVGISQPDLDKLVAAGISTFAEYAFCSTYQPGQASDQPLMDHLRGILGAAPSGAAASSYRRLYFESHALSLQDLKSRLERSESSEARVLPLAEKMERIRQQKQRLQGLIWTPCTEPSNALIDKVCQQMDDGCVAYLELSRCTSRQQETLNEKHDHQLRLDSSGALKLKKQRVDDSPIHGETKLRQAFLRRSLAYDLANIASFTVLETWTNRLFEKMDEAQPSGFRQVSLEQALACDRVLWTRVADATRAKLAADPVAGKPFDKAFEEWSRHPEVLCYLSPLPQATSSRPEQAPKAHAPPKPPAYKGGPGEKGKGKGKGKIQVPDGCSITMEGGKPICKQFNIGKCRAKVAAGKRCMFGFHVCWKCKGQHPHTECAAN